MICLNYQLAADRPPCITEPAPAKAGAERQAGDRQRKWWARPLRLRYAALAYPTSRTSIARQRVGIGIVVPGTSVVVEAIVAVIAEASAEAGEAAAAETSKASSESAAAQAAEATAEAAAAEAAATESSAAKATMTAAAEAATMTATTAATASAAGGGVRRNGTRPVKAAEMVVDSASLV
jgi:hypothetical protein